MFEASDSILGDFTVQADTTIYDDEFMECKRLIEHLPTVYNSNANVHDDSDFNRPPLLKFPVSPESPEPRNNNQNMSLHLQADSDFNRPPLSKFPVSPESPEPCKNNQNMSLHRSHVSVENQNMSLHRSHVLVENLVDTAELIIGTIWTNFPVHFSAQVIPLRLFIQEILRRSRTSWSTLQTTLFYLMRIKPEILLLASNQDNYKDGKNCDPATCGRRMFLASLIVASKYLQDRNYANNAWSKISGLPVQEINSIERRFLKLIDYNLYIGENIFKYWVNCLLSHIQITSGLAEVAFLGALQSEKNQKATAELRQTLWMPYSQTTECSVR